jgi:hypothetical protein
MPVIKATRLMRVSGRVGSGGGPAANGIVFRPRARHPGQTALVPGRGIAYMTGQSLSGVIGGWPKRAAFFVGREAASPGA